MRALEATVLAAVSAFSAFPSPFYADIAAQSSLGIWASAVLFSAHGIAVILAMSWLRASGVSARRAGPWVIVIALGIDAVGGLALAAGMGAGSWTLLLVGRVVTGIALGLATPLLTESLARRGGGTAWATAATLAGVGSGALVAAVLAALGVVVPIVFVVGAAGLVVAALAIARAPRVERSPRSRDAGTPPVPQADPSPAALLDREPAGATIAAPPAPPSAPAARGDSALAIATVLVFATNGVLGLFTSLVPALVVAAVGGGVLLAGTVVAATMIGAGLARVATSLVKPPTVTRLAWAGLAAGLVVFTAGVMAHLGAAILLGSVLIGAACGLGHDAGLVMAIGSKVDALRRVSALARVQRAGQFGLVVPALVLPLFARP